MSAVNKKDSITGTSSIKELVSTRIDVLMKTVSDISEACEYIKK